MTNLINKTIPCHAPTALIQLKYIQLCILFAFLLFPCQSTFRVTIKGTPFVDFYSNSLSSPGHQLKVATQRNYVIAAYGIDIKLVRVICLTYSLALKWSIYVNIPSDKLVVPRVTSILEDTATKVDIVIAGYLDDNKGFVFTLDKDTGNIKEKNFNPSMQEINDIFPYNSKLYLLVGKASSKGFIGRFKKADLSQDYIKLLDNFDKATKVIRRSKEVVFIGSDKNSPTTTRACNVSIICENCIILIYHINIVSSILCYSILNLLLLI